MTLSKRLRLLLDAEDCDRALVWASMDPEERDEVKYNWEVWGRREQLAPPGPWSCWVICAGRGFGKTRAGAEWVRHIAMDNPRARIALVAASLGEARSVMVEGDSGILAVTPDDWRPHYESSLRRLTWDNGAQAMLYSAAEPDSLRGPQHSHAWCDEIAKWEGSAGRATATWDNLAMGMRLGDRAQIVATTTPRAVPLLRRLLGDAEDPEGTTVVTTGATDANAHNLSAGFLDAMQRTYGDSTLGRQEIGGEMLQDLEGALWTRALLEECRRREPAGEAVRVVVGVDPPVSATGDACGIVVAAVDARGRGTVLADSSVEQASPESWARAVAQASAAWNADRIVAEANQGGAMVKSVLHAAEISLPVKLVHAARGKVARAEPVAALYEAGRVRHDALFAKLEDQLCGLLAGGEYRGPGRSPDRADALVWALSELMLGRSGRPRVLPI